MEGTDKRKGEKITMNTSTTVPLDKQQTSEFLQGGQV